MKFIVDQQLSLQNKPFVFSCDPSKKTGVSFQVIPLYEDGDHKMTSIFLTLDYMGQTRHLSPRILAVLIYLPFYRRYSLLHTRSVIVEGTILV